jgi:hypothetical protein
MIPPQILQWFPIVDHWSQVLKISQALLLAIIQTESKGDPDCIRREPEFERSYIKDNPIWIQRGRELGMTSADIASSYGLMQIMFSTAYGYGCFSKAQALDPSQSIRFGAAHLKTLLDRYATVEEALAAYNGGHGAARDLREGKDTPATRYSRRVMELYQEYRQETAELIKKTPDTTVGNYFDLSEFSCKCGCGFCEPDSRLIDALNVIRGKLGAPIIVTSGCRCQKHNRIVGGTPDSVHLRGTAADIKSKDILPVRIWDVTRSLYHAGRLPELSGLGRYKTFIHVDVDDKLRKKDPKTLRQW